MALTVDQVPDVAAKILTMREREQNRLKRISDYMRGFHDSVYVPDGARSEYRWLLQRSIVNFLPLVVSVIAENLHVDGYLPTNPEGEVTDPSSAGSAAVSADPSNPWSIWHANRMQARQHGLHRAVAKYGIAYTVVLPGTMTGPGDTVVDQPVIRAVSPRKLTALYADDVDDEWPVYAVEERLIRSAKSTIRVVWLYDDTNRYTLIGKQGQTGLYWPGTDDGLFGAGWQDIAADLPQIEEHGLGVCPVVRFLHDIDLDGEMDVSGLVEPLIPLQDQINTTTFNTLMAQQYAAFRQRWVTGMVPDDENGRPREPFRGGVDRLFVAEDNDTKFGEFSQPLALDTRVPTPAGWTTIGEMAAGDLVLGRDGRPAHVLGKSPVFNGHTCYRVTFADGTSVVSDGGHKWTVKDRFRPSWGEMTCTTEEIAQQVRLEGVRPGWRWAVPQAEALDLKPAELPVDPYLLGYWLGDGNSDKASLTVGDHDRREVARYIEETGYRIVSQAQDPRTGAWYLRFTVDQAVLECSEPGCDRERTIRSLCDKHYLRLRKAGAEMPPPQGRRDSVQCRLRELGILGNKRIPAPYLRASLSQRIELLQGLMDSDGCANVLKTAVWCAFSNTDRGLIGDVLELMRTLGLRPTCTWIEDARCRVGGIWVLGFQAPGEFIPFRLPRKAGRCPTGRKSSRQRYRSIVAVDEVPSVPVQCIGVDTEDHLFLVGDGFVPTHNTALGDFLDAREASIRHMSTISQVPPYHLLGAVANLSAEALAAARDGLDRAISELQSILSEPYKQTLRLAGLAAGNQAAWQDRTSTVVWRDTSARAFAATADALGKVAQMLGVPATELWSRIPGVSAEEVARWKQVASSQSALDELNRMIEASFTQNANPNGPPNDTEPFQGPASGRQKGI
jgi:hypothetical protein